MESCRLGKRIPFTKYNLQGDFYLVIIVATVFNVFKDSKRQRKVWVFIFIKIRHGLNKRLGVVFHILGICLIYHFYSSHLPWCLAHNMYPIIVCGIEVIKGCFPKKSLVIKTILSFLSPFFFCSITLLLPPYLLRENVILWLINQNWT